MIPVEAATTDELSLRDIYLVLKRRARLILGLTLGLALLTLLWSLLWPKTYASKVVVSLSLANQTNPQGMLNNLPSLSGLAQGFVDLQSTTLLAKDLAASNPTQYYQAKFDDKRGLLNLSARGSTPLEAKERAERILGVARDYLGGRMVEGVRSNIQAALAQTQLDLEAAQESLKRIRAELKTAPDVGQANPTTAAALEARQVDPQAARANSPAYTSLSLDESRFRSQAAQLEARLDTLNRLLNQPEAINQLVGQVLQVQILVPPAEPLRPSFPRPVLFTVVAGVLGLLIGVLWAFIAEALRPQEAAEDASAAAKPAERAAIK